MSNKIDKNMLKNPDVFVSTSDKVFNFVEHHFKTVVGIVGALLLAGVVYVGWGWLNARSELKAAEALYVPEAALRKSEEKFREEKVKAAKPGEKDKKAESAKTEDYAKDYAPAVEEIKSAIKANSNTRAALVSALTLSSFLLQQKQYPAALEVMKLPTFTPPASDLLAGFWLMQTGLVNLENGQTDPALDAYDKVLKSAGLKAFHPEALLKSGVVREMKGDDGKAKEAYERLSREFPETEAAQNAAQFLRLMQMKAPKQG